MAIGHPPQALRCRRCAPARAVARAGPGPHRPGPHRRAPVRPSATLAQAPAPTAAAAKRVPRMPGQLPFFGAVPKVDIRKLFQHVSDTQRREGTRMVEVELLGMKMVKMRHPQDIAQVLKSRDAFPKLPMGPAMNKFLGEGLLSDLDEGHHDLVRAVIMPAFKQDAIRSYAATFAQVADALADVLLESEGAAIDIAPLAQRATLDIIGLTGFSYDFGSVRRASKHYSPPPPAAAAAAGASGAAPDVDVATVWSEILEPAQALFLKLPVPEALVPGHGGMLRAIDRLGEVICHMIAEHRAGRVTDGRRSILTHMLEAQEEGHEFMTDAQMRDELITLMFAGSDTTSTTISFLTWEISRRPDIRARLLAEVDATVGGRDGPVTAQDVAAMPYLAACVNEALRMHSAAATLPRIAAEDVEVGGYHIPKGTHVTADVWSMHRHEDFWPRAGEFLPERWLPENAASLAPHAAKAFMPFGQGGRSCVGRYFAVLEAQVVVAQLLRRVTFPEAAQGCPPLAYKETITLGTQDGLHVIPRARSSHDDASGSAGAGAAGADAAGAGAAAAATAPPAGHPWWPAATGGGAPAGRCPMRGLFS